MPGRLCMLLCAAAFAAQPVAASAAVAPPSPLTEAIYGGIGTWVDIYDGPAWRHPAATVREAGRNGATTLFLQTGSSPPGPAVHSPDRAVRFLRAAHALGMSVVAWYLPPWRRPASETRRALGAIRFERDGERFDAFALDIETAAGSPPAPVRNRRLMRLSQRLRAETGPLYPLGAITPSPSGLASPHGQRWWPDFPFAELRQVYDVFLPMGYYTYHATTAAGAYRDTRANIRILRRETGDAEVPIHLIGGAAADSNAREGRAFARAATRYRIMGASMYDQLTMGAEDWRAVRAVRLDPLGLG